MAYWVDEGFHCWPEIVRAGTAAAGLYSRCGSYIADNLTDGHVPSEVARMYGTPEWIARLVDVGLWTIEEAGFRDTRYFPLNPDAAKVRERKKKAAERQKRYRDSRDRRKTRQSRVSNTSRDASLTMPPTPPKGGRGAPAHDEAGDTPTEHPYVDQRGSCAECGLPESNRRHREVS